MIIMAFSFVVFSLKLLIIKHLYICGYYKVFHSFIGRGLKHKTQDNKNAAL
jgi:hypothetical protein